MDIKFALQNAVALNDALRNCTEKEADALLKAEMRGGRRRAFVLRIFSRFNRMRADRERKEINAKL